MKVNLGSVLLDFLMLSLFNVDQRKIGLEQGSGYIDGSQEQIYLIL